MSFNEDLTELRALLHEPPSPHIWDSICRFFDTCSAGPGLQPLIDYANAHLDAWPDQLRVAPSRWRPHHKGQITGRWSLVRTLNLERNHLNTTSLERHLPPALDHLTILNVSHNLLDDDSISRIASNPRANLSAFAATHNKIGNRGFETLLQGRAFPNLKHLAIDHNCVDERGPQMLAKHRRHPPLISLQIGGNPVGGEGLSWLTGLPWFAQLNALDCSAIGLSGQGHACAAGLLQTGGKLEFLDLSSNALGDGICTELASLAVPLHRLRTLILRDCRISSDGVEDLLQSSPAQLRALTHLDLSYNRVGDRGALLLAATQALPNLEVLDLSANRISSSALEQLQHSAFAQRAVLKLRQERAWQGLLVDI